MRRRHLLLELKGDAADRVQELRAEWDPVMAERIPPHVTLVYPQEVDDEGLLIERTAEAASQTTPFQVRPGELEESNLGGVWMRVVDPTGSWMRLRDLVLGPPFTPYPVTAHITVVHPRTSRRGADALSAMDGLRVDGWCRVDELVYTETGKNGTRTLERFALTGSQG